MTKVKAIMPAKRDKTEVEIAARNAWIKKKTKKILGNILRYALIISISYMILYPLLRMITLTISHPRALGAVWGLWIPPMVSLDNFWVAFGIMDFWNVLWFTTRNVALVMVLQVLNAAFAGYAFARLRFKGMGLLFILVLITFIVPKQVFMLPQRMLFQRFDIFGIITAIRGRPINMLGSPTAMFVLAGTGMGIAGGLFIYIFRQFFRGLPKELEEAAYVDGAGFLRTFFTIVFPMAKPAFLTVGTLSFIWNYNDTHFPTLFNPTNMYFSIRNRALYQLQGGTSILQNMLQQARIAGRIAHDVESLGTPAYDAAMRQVATFVTILPLIVLFLIVQKQFVQGVERSGIVG